MSVSIGCEQRERAHEEKSAEFAGPHGATLARIEEAGGRAVPNEITRNGQDRVVRNRASMIDTRTRRKVVFPFVLVLVSLLSVVAATLFVERRTSRQWNEIAETIDPARATLGEIKLDLALQTAGIRGFALTGDSMFATSYARARANSMSAEAQLSSLASGLDEDIVRSVMALVTTLRHADGLADSLFNGLLPRSEFVTRLAMRQAQLQELVDMSARLDSALAREMTARRERIKQTELIGVWVTSVLVVLALVAAGLVARLGRGYRTLALERERATQSRARLIRGFTHDVKNPLGAADGFLALFEEGVFGELNPEQQDGISKSRRSIRTALDLIGHLLELSRAESGRLEIRRASMDLGATAREVADAFRAQAEQGQLALRLDLPDTVPPFVSDPARVRQILANLLSNAIKYTPAGGHVTVRARTRTDDGAPASGEWIAADIMDTGRGISPEQQHRLFEEFTRFDSGSTEGAGIGLAISQRIAEALGGRITVESQIGTGSTFTLWLPRRRAA